MKITGVVFIDLGELVEDGGWIDTLSKSAREAWCRLSYTRASHVRIDIGEAQVIEWPGHFVADLAACEHVQIVGTYPETVAAAVESLRAAMHRAAA